MKIRSTRKYLILMISLLSCSLAVSAKDGTKTKREGNVPIVLATWSFTNSAEKAWEVLNAINGTSMDAVTQGVAVCEDEQCEGTVGYGGSPDENGESTLDAMLFDGDTMNMGAVGGMRRIKHAISTARRVLENTQHSILVGSLATEFAKNMGFREESLSTNSSEEMWQTWRYNNCQPNYWSNVVPDSHRTCGPYKPLPYYLENNMVSDEEKRRINPQSHDTIGMIAIDELGSIVAGTSSNGARFKIPGRIGDAPLPGAGAYADSRVGAGVATGDGDIMMRFLPSFLIVELMRNGASPKAATTEAISRIIKHYPDFEGAVLGVNKKGNFYAACYGISEFPFAVVTAKKPYSRILVVNCQKSEVQFGKRKLSLQ